MPPIQGGKVTKTTFYLFKLDKSRDFNPEIKSFDFQSDAVPVWVCLLLVLCYISAGASLFCVSHGWSFIDSFFFCLAALGTIGIVDNNAGNESVDTVGAVFVLVKHYGLFIKHVYTELTDAIKGTKTCRGLGQHNIY